MIGLKELGFSKGIIVETIVSTYNSDGRPNAAPMGATILDEQNIIIKPYNSSLTSKNLKSKACAVVNLTHDAELFYNTAFKETLPRGALPFEWFDKAQTVNAPQLRVADAVIEVLVTDMTLIDDRKTLATCKVNFIKAAPVMPKGYCRAFSATIEAIIHATRVKVLAKEKNEQKYVSKLAELITDCNDVVNRVAPNSHYALIMCDLINKVELWRAKSESLC
jgi:hypothetical protein